MKKRIIILVISLIGITGIIVGVSYAFYSYNGKQEFTNSITSQCLKVEYKENSEAITLNYAYPIEDEKGYESKPYNFTFTNVCEDLVSYKINLEVLDTSTLEEEYLDVILDLNEVKKLSEYEKGTVTLANAKSSYILEEGILSGGESITRNLRMWMDYDTTVEQGANKIMQNKIVITAEPEIYTCDKAGISNFKDCLIATQYRETDVEKAKEKIEERGTPDFNKISPTTVYEVVKDEEITYDAYETEIEAYIGTSYVFNENTKEFEVQNASLKKYTDIDLNDGNTYYTCGSWKRGEGDYLQQKNCSTLLEIVNTKSEERNEIIYYDIDAYKIKSNVLETSISDGGLYAVEDDYGMSYYYRGLVTNNYVSFANHIWRIVRINGDGSIRLISTDSVGIGSFSNTEKRNGGYMYGDLDSTNIEEQNANINDSNIKKKVDTWYEKNLLNTEYEKYLSDNLFCGDRSIYKETGSITYLGAYERLTINKTPTLKCPQKNDAYTVNDTEHGNGALKYPIALISADEIAFSGHKDGSANILTYITQKMFTMTPYYLNGEYTRNYIVSEANKGLSSYRVDDPYNSGYPVINIKNNTLFSGGTGTENNPYIITLT